MAASLVQTSAVAVATGQAGVDPLVMSLTGVAAGNSIIVVAFQRNALARTLSVSDNIDGAYTEAITNNPARGTYIYYLHDVTGGNVTITADINTNGTMEAKAFEVSGLDALASPIVASHSDGSSVTAHNCAPSGSIDTSGATFVVAGGVTVSASGVTSTSNGATYTQSTANYSNTLYQYKVAASALTDDRGAWSHAGTAREGISAMAAFPEAAGGVVLTASPGSYAVTGTAATLLRHRVLTTDAGAYAVTGTAASLARGLVLVTDAGSYLLTGANADLLAARRLLADPGAYDITGTSADLIAATNLEMPTDPGVYTLTGTEASLLVHRVLLADPGSYAVTGADAGLARGYFITADPGSYAVTGVDATFARDYVLTGDPGSYTLTGLAADLLKSGSAELTADPGVYALTGVDALMLVHRVLHAEPGAYTLTGATAGLVIPYRLRASIQRRVRRAPHINDEARWLLYRMLQVDLESGLGLSSGQGTDPLVMLRWSDDDGETWSNEYTVSAGRMGEYERRAIWRQLGRSRERVFEVAVSDPITWNLLAAWLKVDKGIS